MRRAGKAGAGRGGSTRRSSSSSSSDARRQVPGAALRRPAAAGGDRPRDRAGAAAGADGRAAVQPRRQAAAGDAHRDPPAAPVARADHGLRHARPGGGAVARRPARRSCARAWSQQIGTPEELYAAARQRATSPTSWATATCSSCEVDGAADGHVSVGADGLTLTRHRSPRRLRRRRVIVRDPARGPAASGEGPNAVEVDGRGRRVPGPRARGRGAYRAGHGAAPAHRRPARAGRRGDADVPTRAAAGVRRARTERAMATRTEAVRGISAQTRRSRLAERGVDRTLLLLLPALVFADRAVRLPVPLRPAAVVPARRRAAGRSPTTGTFFSDPYQRGHDLDHARARAARRRCSTCSRRSRSRTGCAARFRGKRLLTTILVVPITLGTVLTAEGLLNYLGPTRLVQPDAARAVGIIDEPVRLVAQLLGRVLLAGHHRVPVRVPADRCRYLSGIDPTLERAAATLGRRAVAAVPPDHAAAAGARAGDHVLPDASCWRSRSSRRRRWSATRRARRGCISIAAYQAAFEQYDYSMGSAIAMIMGAVELVVIGLVLGVAVAALQRLEHGRQGMTPPPADRVAPRPGAWLRVGRRRRSSSSTWPGDRRGAGRARSAPAGSTPGCPRASRPSGTPTRGGVRALARADRDPRGRARRWSRSRCSSACPAAYALARRHFPGKRLRDAAVPAAAS